MTAERTRADVVAARGGDRGALQRLFRGFAPVVHGVLLSYVQPADADDLTQDVFETALRRLHELRDPAAFPGWIVAIARRAALDALRRRRDERELDVDLVADPGSSEDRLEARRVLALLQTLPAAYRETLVLRLVEGFDGNEIAARTGLTPGSVRVNLHRGMALLRAAIEHPPGAEP